MSLIVGDDFQHILRVLNTNVDGRTKVMYALTQIRGIGRRFSNVVCKKAEIDMGKRAGELSAAELESAAEKELDDAAAMKEDRREAMLNTSRKMAETARAYFAEQEAREAERVEVRSIHWFPYDRAGVVNADP